jgi:curved DNA-binding protein CbpA
MSGLLDFVYDSEIFIDLYEILEVELDAKLDEIKQAYIKMAKKNHPDQGGSSDKFQEITRAYEILFNKETRKEYDLYYLKKSMAEFKGDDTLRLQDDFKNFMSSNTKPISKEELDKLYAETFVEYRDQYKESIIGEEELADRINDITIERKNMQIETSDDTLSNFISQNKDKVNINDVFEYLKYKNSQAFSNSNSIMLKEWGTLDQIQGYSNGYSSFVDDNEYFDSNLYSNISNMNAIQESETKPNLNLDEFIQWKTTKHTDTKLTTCDIDTYLKRRQEEQENIFNDVQKNLESNTKVKQVEKFLKTKHLKENVDEYYNNLDQINQIDQIDQIDKLDQINQINQIDQIDKLDQIDQIDQIDKLDQIDQIDQLDQISSTIDKKKFTKPEIKKSSIPEIINLDDINSNNVPIYTNSNGIDGMLKFMDEINSTNKQDLGELEKEIGIDKIVKKQDEYTELKASANITKANNVRKREYK